MTNPLGANSAKVAVCARGDITAIVLTFNEEPRIFECLDSLRGVVDKVFVVDSYSTDRTPDILRERGIAFEQRRFDNYAQQRNWAQANNPHATEWVLHLDADERLSDELRAWLNNEFPARTAQADGFLFSRRTMFLGRWMRHGGHYPAYHLRLFRAGAGRCERKAYDQHFVADGRVETVPRADIIDTFMNDLTGMIASHNRWATMDAEEIVAGSATGELRGRLGGSPIEQRRWFKRNLFGRAPLLWRAFAYFAYRYVFRLGFLDGREGLIFHVLQGFWFRFLVDAKVHELRLRQVRKDSGEG